MIYYNPWTRTDQEFLDAYAWAKNLVDTFVDSGFTEYGFGYGCSTLIQKKIVM